MAVYKNRNIWDGTDDKDIYIEIDAGQIVMQQKGVDQTDIIVVDRTDVPKLIEYLQQSIAPKGKSDGQENNSAIPGTNLQNDARRSED